jgi:dTDP-4-amino-4,6-dideoxygalactose transaminase
MFPGQRVEPAAVEVDHAETIRYLRPDLPPLSDIARYYALSEEARWYSNGGPCYERFARRLAAYVGGDVHCVPVSNCTLGLMAALRDLVATSAPSHALVAVPSFTFIATACAIRWAGFEPLFVDIEPDSWQLDPDGLAEALARHDGTVAAVIGCSTFGTPAPAAVRAAWRAICADADVPLLIDSAAGFGALDQDGRLLGRQGETEVFSFHATKPFAIGEGGTIVTPDPDAAARLRQMINFGLDPNTHTSAVAGLNAKLSELGAATGLAMLDRFDEALAARRASARRLQARLAAYPLTYQAGSEGSTWQGLQLLLPDTEVRERAVSLAHALGVEIKTYFDPPLHRHPAFAQARVCGGLEVTEAIAGRSLSLPMANHLGARPIGRIADLLQQCFECSAS